MKHKTSEWVEHYIPFFRFGYAFLSRLDVWCPTRRSVPWWTPEFDSCSERGGFGTHARQRTSLRWAHWEWRCLSVMAEGWRNPLNVENQFTWVAIFYFLFLFIQMLLHWNKKRHETSHWRTSSFSHMNSPPHTWFPLEEVLCLDGCDLWHGGEDMGTVRSCSLQTVAVVDLSIACFLIHVELSETETGQRVHEEIALLTNI